MPRSGIVHTLDEAERSRTRSALPLIIRPAFTLGGTGGGIAYNIEEFETIVQRGLDVSPVTEVLIEESLLGWKEFELEVMRDRDDNCVIICSIENFDPMGVHTGDSITVAPIQTLTDKEFQIMRDAAFAVIREIGVETGGSNIQFAINPDNGRMVVIEMNPRVSRSPRWPPKPPGSRSRRSPPNWRWDTRWTKSRTTSPAKRRPASSRPSTIRRQNPALDVRKIPRCRRDADHADEKRRRSDGDRAHVQGSTAKSAAQPGVKRFGLGGTAAKRGSMKKRCAAS